MSHRLLLASLALMLILSVGCSGDSAPQSVTEGIDAQSIADYEAELAKVTSQDISTDDDGMEE